MAALAAAAALAITSTVIAVPVQAAPEELMNSTFEDGYGAWKGVGSTISITSDYAHNGNSSLYVFDRTADWGAPRCSLSGVAVPGQTYTFSAYAMFADGNDYQNMALKLLYTDSSGQDQYKDIKNVSAKKGEWTELTGSYSIPENVTNIILYVEMPGANTDQCYYIDDITVNGEKVDVSYETEYNNDFDDGTAQGLDGQRLCNRQRCEHCQPQRGLQLIHQRKNTALERCKHQQIRYAAKRQILFSGLLCYV